MLILTACAVAAGGYAALRLARSAVPAPAANAVAPAPTVPAPDSQTQPPPEPIARPAPPLKPTTPRTGVATNAARAAPKKIVETPVAPPPAMAPVAAEPPVAAPASAPEPVPVARPAPDRWQQMADAIAQCGRDGFFAGVICEQRVRLQYCDGHWGKAAQCPERIENDHGGR